MTWLRSHTWASTKWKTKVPGLYCLLFKDGRTSAHGRRSGSSLQGKGVNLQRRSDPINNEDDSSEAELLCIVGMCEALYMPFLIR